MTYEGADYLIEAETLTPQLKHRKTGLFGASMAISNLTARAILSEQRGPDSYYEKC